MAVFRSLITLGIIYLIARMFGKEQLTELTFLDWVVGITIGSVGANMATDVRGNTWNYLLVLAVFAGAVYAIRCLSPNSKPLRKIIECEPTVVIHNGKILEHNMRKLRYNMDSLLDQLRDKDVFKIEDVEFAILEENGTMSLLLKSHRKVGLLSEADTSGKDEQISDQIIADGFVLYQNLRQNGLDEQWLIAELKNYGYNSPREITSASLGSDGSLSIDGR